MNHQDIRTLKILEEIDNDHSPSQRDLAKSLNVSLGLVNSFVKRLSQKGYFEITTRPKNRVKYILTPKGAAEKTRLTYEFMHYSHQFYKKARYELRLLFHELAEQGVKNVVFYGAGELAEIAYLSLKETSIGLAGVVDDDRAGEKFLSHYVKDPSILASLNFDRLLITSIGSIEEVLKRISKRKIPKDKLTVLK